MPKSARYFLREGEEETGPYQLKELKALLRTGRLSRQSRVRAEHEEVESSLGVVLAKRRVRRRHRVVSGVEAGDVAQDAAAYDGSYTLGFIAGLIGGLIVLLLVLRRGKPNTRAGVYFGFAMQLLLGLTLGSCR